MKETKLSELFEANSVIFETTNGKTTALYIEEAMKCVGTWLIERQAHFIGKHRYCQDVKTSMDTLIKEVKDNYWNILSADLQSNSSNESRSDK